MAEVSQALTGLARSIRETGRDWYAPQIGLEEIGLKRAGLEHQIRREERAFEAGAPARELAQIQLGTAKRAETRATRKVRIGEIGGQLMEQFGLGEGTADPIRNVTYISKILPIALRESGFEHRGDYAYDMETGQPFTQEDMESNLFQGAMQTAIIGTVDPAIQSPELIRNEKGEIDYLKAYNHYSNLTNERRSRLGEIGKYLTKETKATFEKDIKSAQDKANAFLKQIPTTQQTLLHKETMALRAAQKAKALRPEKKSDFRKAYQQFIEIPANATVSMGDFRQKYWLTPTGRLSENQVSENFLDIVLMKNIPKGETPERIAAQLYSQYRERIRQGLSKEDAYTQTLLEATKESLPEGLSEEHIKIYEEKGLTRKQIINRYKKKMGIE